MISVKYVFVVYFNVINIILQEGFWNLSSGRGCQPCNCREASNSSSCDVLTGQCLCKYGVEGLSCSSCIINGFYDYSADGCSGIFSNSDVGLTYSHNIYFRMQL